MEIKNKVALVLGASKGLGRSIARALADSGTKLVLPYHNDWPKESEDMKKEFAWLGENHFTTEADLRDARQVKALLLRWRKNSAPSIFL